MKLDYHEISLQDVINYFVDGFVFDEGYTLHSHEAFIDQAKGKVIFRLSLNEPEKFDLESKEGAIGFLQRTGIMDDQGNVKPEYM